MPELPEVETIRRDLEKNILGKKITKIEILEPKTVGFLGKTFKKKVERKTIKEVKRRAKLLIISFSSDLFMVVHLKITGQLIIKKAKDKLDKFTRVVFYLSNKKKLIFNDIRKFGYLKLFDKEGLSEMFKTMKFGPEPLEKDFTFKVFNDLLSKKKNFPIKPLLMEPTFIAGVGNIYAAEACFYAHIKPVRKVKTLEEREKRDLFKEIKKVLILATKHRGTSADTYLDIFGKKGKYEPLLKVYGRKGEKCYRCSGEVKRIALRDRGTFFCPKCQK